MRMLMDVKLPHREFNEAVRKGTAGDTLNRILEATNAEAVYFTERDGQRGVTMAVEVPDSSRVPALAEPWFLAFNADVSFRIAMTPEDLGRAGLEDLGRRWA